MSDTSDNTSRVIIKRFTLGGVGIFLLFAILFIGVATNGGVDVFIAIAPTCFISYQLVMSIYVGAFMAAYSKSKGSSPWLWGTLGFVITAGLYGAQLLVPPLAILAPILSSMLTIFLIGLPRKHYS